MSRATRTARGALGASFATLFAATSHSLGGGAITPLSVVATIALALPLCVALAGRTGSLWRLTVAVTASQFVYHWAFAGLGAGSDPAAGAGSAAANGGPAVAALSPHASHLGMLSAFDSGPLAVGTEAGVNAGLAMWLAHGLAAILTIALLHRGETAVLALGRVVLRAVLTALPATALATPAPRPALRTREPGTTILERLCCPAAITHRGPPALMHA